MKLKIIICLFFFVLYQKTNVYAQNSICDVIQYSVPVRPWWYEQTWEVYANLGGNQAEQTIVSPFYTNDYHGYSNIRSIAESTKKDFLYEDGWRCITKHIGIPQNPADNPYFVFYNIYTAKIRLLLYVTVLHTDSNNSNSNGIDAKSAYIRIRPVVGVDVGDSPNRNRIVPNILTELSQSTETIIENPSNRDYIIPQFWENRTRYWIMAEFPISYDPCTCKKTNNESVNEQAKISFSFHTTNSEAIELCNFAKKKDENCDNIFAEDEQGKKLTKTGAVISNLSSFAKELGGTAKDIQGAIPNFKDAFDKLFGLSQEDLLQSEAMYNEGGVITENYVKALKFKYSREKFDALSDGLSNLSSYALLTASGLEMIAPILKLFIGNDKKVGGTGFQAFYSKGQITSTTARASGDFLVPGSYHTEDANPLDIPQYDNVMGIMNVLKRPVLNAKYEFFDEYYAQNSNAFLYFEVAETPKIVINPALEINLEQSEINVSFEFENKLSIPTYKWFYESPEKGSPARQALNLDFATWQMKDKKFIPFYVTPFFPIGCVSGQQIACRPFKHWISKPGSTTAGSGGLTVGGYYGFDLPKKGTVFMKVYARLRRKNSNDKNKDLIYVNRYAVDLNMSYNNSNFENRRQSVKNNLGNVSRGNHITYYGWYPGYGTFNDWDSGNYPVEANQTLTIIGGYDMPENVKNFYSGKSIDVLPIDGQGSESFVEFTEGTNLGINESFDVSSATICPNQSQNLIKELNILDRAYIADFCNGRDYKVAHNLLRPTSQSQASTSDLITDLRVFPNPATGASVDMTYSISTQANVSVIVYNSIGEKVGVLVNESKDTGKYDITWDINYVPNGLYFCTLEINGKRIVKRLVIQK